MATTVSVSNLVLLMFYRETSLVSQTPVFSRSDHSAIMVQGEYHCEILGQAVEIEETDRKYDSAIPRAFGTGHKLGAVRAHIFPILEIAPALAGTRLPHITVLMI